MQLLYEKPAGAGLTPDTDQLSDPDPGRLPLPILLRVPRFAYPESVSLPTSPTPDHTNTVAAVSPPKPRNRASGFKFRAGRKRRKVVGLIALALLVIPVAVVSRDPSLIAPLVESWCDYGSGREPAKEISDYAASPSAGKTITADTDVHPRRSAWLGSDIVPFKQGESP
jgi:hypothetical protein